MAVPALVGTGGYVAAAYLIFLALVLVYVALIAAKLSRTRRQLMELADRAGRDDPG
jgi:hypothetical protein